MEVKEGTLMGLSLDPDEGSSHTWLQYSNIGWRIQKGALSWCLPICTKEARGSFNLAQATDVANWKWIKSVNLEETCWLVTKSRWEMLTEKTKTRAHRRLCALHITNESCPGHKRFKSEIVRRIVDRIRGNKDDDNRHTEVNRAFWADNHAT